MSYIVAATANHIGMRRARNRPTLGVWRAPAEMEPVSQLFGTRALHGMGALYTNPLQLNAGSPFVRQFGAASTSAATTPTTQAAMASPTPSINAGGVVSEHVLANPSLQRNWQQFMNSEATSTQTTPTPNTVSPAQPSTPPALTSGAATTAQAGTPVPVGYPTSQAYVDSGGNIWTFTPAAGWQLTGNVGTTTAAAAEAAAQAPSVTVTDTTSDWAGEITAWLQSSSIWASVPNFWLVAGVGVVGLILYPRGKR